MMERTTGLSVLLAITLSLAGCAKSDFPLTAQERTMWKQVKPQEIARAPEAPDPKILPRTHFAAARLLEERGETGRAMIQYRKAIALNHKYVAAYHRLGLLQSKAGDHASAMQTLSRAVNLQPKSADLHNDLGVERMIQQNWDDAAESFYRAIEINPKFARARVNLGLTLGKQQRFEEALASFRTVLPDADAYYNMGLVYNGHKKYVEAGEAFRHALRVDPDFTVASTKLEQISEQLAQSIEDGKVIKLAEGNETSQTPEKPGRSKSVQGLPNEVNSSKTAQATTSQRSKESVIVAENHLDRRNEAALAKPVKEERADSSPQAPKIAAVEPQRPAWLTDEDFEEVSEELPRLRIADSGQSGAEIVAPAQEDSTVQKEDAESGRASAKKDVIGEKYRRQVARLFAERARQNAIVQMAANEAHKGDVHDHGKRDDSRQAMADKNAKSDVPVVSHVKSDPDEIRSDRDVKRTGEPHLVREVWEERLPEQGKSKPSGERRKLHTLDRMPVPQPDPIFNSDLTVEIERAERRRELSRIQEEFAAFDAELEQRRNEARCLEDVIDKALQDGEDASWRDAVVKEAIDRIAFERAVGPETFIGEEMLTVANYSVTDLTCESEPVGVSTRRESRVARHLTGADTDSLMLAPLPPMDPVYIASMLAPRDATMNRQQFLQKSESQVGPIARSPRMQKRNEPLRRATLASKVSDKSTGRRSANNDQKVDRMGVSVRDAEAGFISNAPTPIDWVEEFGELDEFLSILRNDMSCLEEAKQTSE